MGYEVLRLMVKGTNMKKNILKLTLMGVTIMMALGACGKANGEKPTETNATAMVKTETTDSATADATKEYASVWDKLKAQYAKDNSVNQLLFVQCTGGSKADVVYLKKNANGEWVVDMERKADIGKAGLGKVKEGDKKTPEGVFGVRQAFGILDNPGTAHKYYKVTKDTYCCGEHCKYYNTIIEASKLNHKCRGEHLISYKPQYDYGFETTYNNDNVYGKGSAVFVHVKGSKGFTMGCIGLDKDMMKHIIMDSDPGIKICIYKK